MEGNGSLGERNPGAVTAVTHDRAPPVGKLPAKLVPATRAGLELHERNLGRSLQQPDGGDRLLPLVLGRRFMGPRPVAPMRQPGQLILPVAPCADPTGKTALDEGQIGLLHGACPKLLRQRRGGDGAFGEDHDAGNGLVQPTHDADEWRR